MHQSSACSLNLTPACLPQTLHHTMQERRSSGFQETINGGAKHCCYHEGNGELVFVQHGCQVGGGRSLHCKTASRRASHVDNLQSPLRQITMKPIPVGNDDHMTTRNSAHNNARSSILK
ncbi:uncharacterized protein MYCFIDRAFT_211287 [Pseudocercospora fijiensis CIRAD86]|uniref:Uncharacterized protein n=1 Tax=Pseudocercospora fijiensis (strain CIRAD86) TaxID=383855 RepID=M2ZWA9_PSEFD|nr:uncharacterized protein MYCFIDRAFT_211287 [Pseudocercospora fijiensis CIRAD86]EME83269.1 hypothetical protein MYCFIDRAFT_182764 [Pseudocercospora fijiensis CIRAD86]